MRRPAALSADRGSLALLSLLMLLTIVVPWDIQGSEVTWSWEALQWASGGYVAFVLGLWVIAGLTFVLGYVIRGLVLSISLAALSTAGIVLLFVAFGSQTGLKLSGPLELFASNKIVPSLIPLFAALLYLAGQVRWQAGGAPVMGMFEALAGTGCVILLSLLLMPDAGKLIDEYRSVRSLNSFLNGRALQATWMIVCLLLLFAGGMVGIIHGLRMDRPSAGPAKVVSSLVCAAVVMFLAKIAFEPLMLETTKGLIGSFTGVMVLYSMPVLFCSSVSRLIGAILARTAARTPIED